MPFSSLGAETRRARLLEIMERTGSIDLSAAAVECNVSEMTIRRDIAELERQGLARRVRGGAIGVEPEGFEHRMARNRSAKEKIRTKLESLMPSVGLVGMDSSSTVYRLAHYMGTSPISVMTTGIETFHTVRSKVSRAFLTGGEYEVATGALVGPVALRTLADHHYTRVFASCTALSPEHGASDSALEVADLKRTFRKHTDSFVLAIDSTKLGRTACAIGLGLAEIDLLVTELDPDDPALEPYRSLVEIM